MLLPILAILGACQDAPVSPDATLPDPRMATTVSTSTCLYAAASDSSLLVGDSAKLSTVILRRKVNGQTISGTPAWSSSDPRIVSIAGNYARGLRAGAVVLMATLSSCSATVPITVADRPASDTTISPVVRSVTVVGTASMPVGDQQRFTASVDASGGAATTVTWSSEAPAVATVSADGVVSAVAPGTATIRATSTATPSVSGTLAVTVVGLVRSITVAPTAVTLATGTTQQLTATVTADPGLVTTVTWRSSAPAVATVSATGLVTAVGPGTASVTALANADTTRRASSAITTTAPPPAPTKQLALALRVLDGTAATPLSSSGIPLPKGWLFEKDLATTALSDGTKEVPRVLRALQGRYADGSLRSVLLQYQANPAVTTMQLQVGVTRTLADPAPWPIPTGTPQAVTYPRDQAFLLSTGLVGPTIPVADNPNTTYETQFRTFADQHWQANGAQWEHSNYYDRASNHFAYWIRSGDIEYWKRAVALAINYRDQYLVGSGFNPSPHWMALEGVAMHYWLTGDPASRTAVVNSAGRATAAFSPAALANPTGEYIEGRIQARMLIASLLAWELGDTSDSWSTKTTAYVNNIMALQQTTGRYAWPNWCSHQGNFMVGLQNDALIKYHERHTANPAVVTTIKRAVDYLHQSSWRPASRAFTYIDIQCTGPDDLLPVPDLNMLIVNGFAFIGKQTGDRRYVAIADSVADGAIAGAWLAGSKQFNQQYYDSYHYLWYRR